MRCQLNNCQCKYCNVKYCKLDGSNYSLGVIMAHSESHFGRYGKGHCLFNDTRTVGLLQLSPVWHVGCESEETSMCSELCHVNYNKDQTF